MGFDKFVISGLMIGLFSFSLLMFAMQISIDNNSDKLLNTDLMNNTFNDINKSLLNIQETSEAEYNATSSEPLSKGYGTIILLSIRTAGNVFTGIITAILNPIFKMATTYLGIPPVVIGIFTAVIFIIVIFGIWKMWRAGQ